MKVNGVHSTVSINAVRESSVVSNTAASNDISVNNNTDSPNDVLDVSERARSTALDALQLKDKNDNDGSLNINENDFSEESAEKLQQEDMYLISRPTDPFTYADQMSKVHYDFASYTPESKINNILEGKSKNSSVVTKELSNMLHQTITNKNGSVNERAANREMGLKCAQSIANQYVTDPNEATAFMSAINEIYDTDVKTDEGYMQLDTKEGKKWVESGSILCGDKVLSPDYTIDAFRSEYCKAHGLSNTMNLSKSEFSAYIDELNDFLSSSSQETLEEFAQKGKQAFAQNKNQVTTAIQHAKLNFNDSLFNQNMARLLKAF